MSTPYFRLATTRRPRIARTPPEDALKVVGIQIYQALVLEPGSVISSVQARRGQEGLEAADAVFRRVRLLARLSMWTFRIRDVCGLDTR